MGCKPDIPQHNADGRYNSDIICQGFQKRPFCRDFVYRDTYGQPDLHDQPVRIIHAVRRNDGIYRTDLRCVVC